jgi:hypothetical protein
LEMNERTLFDDGMQERDRPPNKPIGLPPPETDARSAAHEDKERDKRRNRLVGVPHNGTDTSHAAAERITPVAISQAARVFHFIAQCGDEGATDHEVQSELGLTGDSERPRRCSLHRAGLIRDSRQRRKSPTGRQAIVWIATEKKWLATEVQLCRQSCESESEIGLKLQFEK